MQFENQEEEKIRPITTQLVFNQERFMCETVNHIISISCMHKTKCETDVRRYLLHVLLLLFPLIFCLSQKKKKRFSPTKTTFLGLTFSCGGNFSLRGNQKNTVCVCVTNTHTSNSVRTCETCWIIVTRALDVPGTAD